MHSAILLTFIKLPFQFVIKIIVLSIFEWPIYTGVTVYKGLHLRKPVFGVSDKARLKSISSATETT